LHPHSSSTSNSPKVERLLHGLIHLLRNLILRAELGIGKPSRRLQTYLHLTHNTADMVGVAVHAQARLALHSSLQHSGSRCAICRSVLYLLKICALSSRTNSASSVLKPFARDNNIDSSNRLFCFRSSSKDGIERKSESTKCDVIALMPSAFALRKISLTLFRQEVRVPCRARGHRAVAEWGCFCEAFNYFSYPKLEDVPIELNGVLLLDSQSGATTDAAKAGRRCCKVAKLARLYQQ
jgi:hypothetical protein